MLVYENELTAFYCNSTCLIIMWKFVQFIFTCKSCSYSEKNNKACCGKETGIQRQEGLNYSTEQNITMSWKILLG